MASIITGVQFQHTYTLYGTVDITVAVLTKQEARKLYTALQAIDQIVKSPFVENAEVKQQMAELHGTMQLYAPIVRIQTWKDKQLQKQFEPAHYMMEACQKIINLQWFIEHLVAEDRGGDISVKEGAPHPLDELLAVYKDYCVEDKLSTLPDVMLETVIRTHTNLYNILLETGFDENFWKGIELA